MLSEATSLSIEAPGVAWCLTNDRRISVLLINDSYETPLLLTLHTHVKTSMRDADNRELYKHAIGYVYLCTPPPTSL